MLNCQNGGITPMVDGENDELATFETEDGAREAADNCSLGAAFGYEIFERGYGV